jgi:hypothetical protein
MCIRKVTVHLGYSTYILLSVLKLPLKCAVVSLHSVVKQRLKCNTGKVFNCLIQFLLTMIPSIASITFCKRIATSWMHLHKTMPLHCVHYWSTMYPCSRRWMSWKWYRYKFSKIKCLWQKSKEHQAVKKSLPYSVGTIFNNANLSL